jgi:hypothetical protein
VSTAPTPTATIMRTGPDHEGAPVMLTGPRRGLRSWRRSSRGPGGSGSAAAPRPDVVDRGVVSVAVGVTAALVLGALALLPNAALGPGQGRPSAAVLADQLSAQFAAFGLASPPRAPTERLLGDDGGEVCRLPVRRAGEAVVTGRVPGTVASMVSDLLIDSPTPTALALVMAVYCPDRAARLDAYLARAGLVHR